MLKFEKGADVKVWGIPPPKGVNAVVVAFWTPTSDSCIDQMKALQKIAADRPDVMVIAITRGANKKERAEAKKTIEKEGLELTFVNDTDSRLAKEVFRVGSVPAFFIVDKTGRTVTQEISSVDGNVRYDTFERLLDSVRAGEPVALIDATPVDWSFEKKNRGLVGKSAPEFSERDAGGVLRSIESYAGRNLILVFWAPKCPHCERELPRLQQFIDSEGRNLNAEILTVAIADNMDAVKTFNKSAGIRIPVIFDKDKSLNEAYQVSAVPIIYIINEHGVVVEALSGEHPWVGALLSSVLADRARTVICGLSPRIIAGFSTSIKNPKRGQSSRHLGIDVIPKGGQTSNGPYDVPNRNGPYNAPICAAADGEVVEAGWGSRGRGINVVIRHGNDIETLYSHGSKVLVKKGQIVHKGDLIMLMGSTGVSTGNHLHFETRSKGIPVDPYLGIPSSVALVEEKALLHTYPNPWRTGNNDICFNVEDVSWGDGPLNVSIVIYDIRGKLVRKIEKTWDAPAQMSGPTTNGKATKNLACWDVRNDKDGPVASGVYLYKLKACDKISCEQRQGKASVVR